MKKNPNDRYATTDNDIIIEDENTGEQMLFFIDSKNRLVIRSFLEEDIKPFINKSKITSSMKRQKIKMLYSQIPQKDSEKYFFCIEKILFDEEDEEIIKKEEKNGIRDYIYGLPRIPIGMAGKSDEEITLKGKIPSEISAVLYEKDMYIARCIDEMLSQLMIDLNCESKEVLFLK